MQTKLFDIEDSDKSYRAIRHDIVRDLQNNNDALVHHPHQKEKQIRDILIDICNWGDLSILELFAGQGNCTKIYSEFGEVYANEKKKTVFDKLQQNTKDLHLVHCNNVDSYLDFHKLIYLKQKFDVIDLDPYGFPNRFMPDIFLLIDDGVMFVTMPKPYVNVLNGITQNHLLCYFGEPNPSKETIIKKIAIFALCHWRKVELISEMDLKSVWRFAFKVEKVKATEYTGVKNR